MGLNALAYTYKVCHLPLPNFPATFGGVARGGPSRARPDQLCCSKILLLLYNYDPCNLIFIERDVIFLENQD